MLRAEGQLPLPRDCQGIVPIELFHYGSWCLLLTETYWLRSQRLYAELQPFAIFCDGSAIDVTAGRKTIVVGKSPQDRSALLTSDRYRVSNVWLYAPVSNFRDRVEIYAVDPEGADVAWCVLSKSQPRVISQHEVFAQDAPAIRLQIGDNKSLAYTLSYFTSPDVVSVSDSHVYSMPQLRRDFAKRIGNDLYVYENSRATQASLTVYSLDRAKGGLTNMVAATFPFDYVINDIARSPDGRELCVATRSWTQNLLHFYSVQSAGYVLKNVFKISADFVAYSPDGLTLMALRMDEHRRPLGAGTDPDVFTTKPRTGWRLTIIDVGD